MRRECEAAPQDKGEAELTHRRTTRRKEKKRRMTTTGEDEEGRRV